MSQGYGGIIDFSFLPSGQAFVPPTPPSTPGPAGFLGFFGFPCFPVGAGTGQVPTSFGHGFRGAGQVGRPTYFYAIYAWQIEQLRRFRVNEEKKKKKKVPPPAKPALDMLVEKGRAVVVEREKRVAEGQMYATLLAII